MQGRSGMTSSGRRGFGNRPLIKEENSSQLQNADTCFRSHRPRKRLSGKAVFMHTCQLRGEDPWPALEDWRLLHPKFTRAPPSKPESCSQHSPPPTPPHALLQSSLALPRGGNRETKGKHFLAVEGQSLILRSFSPISDLPTGLSGHRADCKFTSRNLAPSLTAPPWARQTESSRGI